MAREGSPILLQRRGMFLVAADRMTETFIQSLPQGKNLRARDITQPRSRPRMRLYWALVHLVSDNLTDVPVKALHQWIKLKLGIVDAVPLKSGKIDYVPSSIAFDSMDETEFAPYLDRTIDLIVTELIPGLGRDDLLKMAEEMTR